MTFTPLRVFLSTVKEDMTFTPLRDFEADYEIEVDEPHRIRKRGSDRFVTPSLQRDTGYVRVRLNGRNYRYHRILAKHFIPNPDDLPQVDHIDRNPLNNTLENLRWVSSSDNNRNRVINRARFEYLHDPPNDLIEITRYNDFEFEENKYFFCGENDRIVQRYSDHRWKWLAQTPHQGYLRISMCDINGRYHQIYAHKIINHFRNEQVEDDEE